MSDIDSLDGLVDDIDIDAIDSGKPSDLDDILDDCAEQFLSTESSLKFEKGDSVDDSACVRLDDHLEEKAIQELKCAMENVPHALKNKWMGILSSNIDTEEQFKFVPSYAYMGWDKEYPQFSVEKNLKDIVLRASVKSGLSDSQSSAVEAAIRTENSVTQRYISKILDDKKDTVRNDCNFDSCAFSCLSNAVTSTS
mmetsp:Transcript_14825/g.22317  ORF Transcript_14825/g.22317 Transcript_14825/m.22317 type:complete len:196 (-) Transcript_14825:41-628(-)